MVRGGFVSVLGEVEHLVLVWSGTDTQQQTHAVVKTLNHSLIFKPEAFFFSLWLTANLHRGPAASPQNQAL